MLLLLIYNLLMLFHQMDTTFSTHVSHHKDQLAHNDHTFDLCFSLSPDGKHIFLRVYRNLQQHYELTAVQTGKTAVDPLVYF